MTAERGDAGELAEPAGDDGVREKPDPERREDVDEPRLVLGRERLPDRQPPRQRPEERRHDVEQKREDDPAPDDDLERIEDASPLGPAPPEDVEREDERDDSDSGLRPARPPHAPARASCRASLRDARSRSRRRRPPRAASRSRATRSARRRARAPLHPCAARRGSSSTSAHTASASACGSSGGDGDGGLGRQHLAVAGNVRRDRRERARERAREHHAEALLADRRRDERLRAEQRLRQLVLAEEADDVDPVVRDAKAREHESDGERVGAGDRQPQARSPWISGHARSSTCRPLRGSCLPAKTIRCSRSPAGADGGTSTPFGNHLVRRREASGSATPSRAPTRRCDGRCGRSGSPRAASRPRIQPRSPDAWNVATSGQRARMSVVRQIVGVIGSCRWRTSKRSRSSARTIRK